MRFGKASSVRAAISRSFFFRVLLGRGIGALNRRLAEPQVEVVNGLARLLGHASN